MDVRYSVILEKSKDGGYAAHVPSLPGCHTQGETIDETLDNARDAIKSYLAAQRQVARHLKKGGARVFEVEIAA